MLHLEGNENESHLSIPPSTNFPSTVSTNQPFNKKRKTTNIVNNSRNQKKRGNATQSILSSAPSKKFRGFLPRKARWATYLLGFVALWLLLWWGYGDVLARAEQDSYISTSSSTLHYLLSQPAGWLFWSMRWLLLAFKWSIVGGACLAAVWTLTARLSDYALRMPHQLEGLGFIIPLLEFGWMAWRGTNLYYKNEPSLFILVALAVLIVMALLAAATWAITRNHKAEVPDKVRPYGLALALVLTTATAITTRIFNENVILTARLQNMQAEQDWEGMIKVARSARRPSKAIAAYHAVALEETDQLLDGMYEIGYDFPKINFDKREGSEEDGIYTADCNFHAGLLNAAYRCALEHTVMNGPRLYAYKRAAVCALLNGEKALCRKYLALIDKVPFEGAFVEKYAAMLRDPKLISEDEELTHVLSLAPKEDHYEQNYQQPLFLGYNVGVNNGTEATLITSTAACLYSKDLQRFMLRAQIFAQKGKTLPLCMQQAIAILSIKQPSILQAFPQVSKFVQDDVINFLMDARPYIKDRLKLRSELRERWLGTYMYYYYTENNDPDQVVKPTQNKASVN